ncbi:MAG: C_GCAxxG_C_C family protein [Desulfobacteraceae bacterium]|nr:C_GCAxxG_C_C family protein [Desulfobacteraceae bacterium]
MVSAILEAFDADSTQALSHATAFGAGMGRTFDEACGAFSGGLIAIGHLHGRQRPRENWDIPATLAANLRDRFICTYQTTHCKTLRDHFGEDMQAEECSRLVCKVTIELLELLQKYPDKIRVPECGCT